MGALLFIPGMVSAAFQAVAGIWKALPTPVQVALALVLAFGLGFWRGEKHADKVWQVRLEKSLRDAAAIDAAAATAARQAAVQQAHDAEERAAAAETAYAEFAKTATDRLGDCLLDEDAAGRINGAAGHGVPERGIRRSAPLPPGR